MSLHEQEADYNLSESGVHLMLLRQLLADNPAMMEDLLARDLIDELILEYQGNNPGFISGIK